MTVQPCIGDAPLYRWYQGQTEQQRAYVELSLRDGVLLATYDAVIGGGRPQSVAMGIDRRHRIPVLTAEAATALLYELAPLAQRVLDDCAIDWNGEHFAAVLGPDAVAAEEIAAVCARRAADGDDAEGLTDIWDIGSIGTLRDADDAGITAATTDAELVSIATTLLAEFREGMGQPHAVIHRLDAHLRELRDDLAADQDD
ncbi:hypothetical protein [Yinghuangia seranimata]|uniref:hypothetical protein n=1 Tax=Yinghuangia seranimata TaxID=408067 RepID=UPI00248CF9BB|nr:hypothetical protein [Yinghuangia seranimata]MDI2127606.1 hypothetical protein [Yinghuangia seranimata]